MNYSHPSEIMDEIARLTPTFTGVSFARIDELGSIQWPCNAEHPEGTPTMHVGEFVRGKGKFLVTEYVPTAEKVNARYPLILTTGRILSQYNVGAQTRRTENNRWHDEDRLEIHPHDAEERGIVEGDWVGIESRAGDTVLRARVTERVQPGVVYTTFHFPGIRGQRHHHRQLGLGHELSGIQGHRRAGHPRQPALRVAEALPRVQRDPGISAEDAPMSCSSPSRTRHDERYGRRRSAWRRGSRHSGSSGEDGE